MGTPLSPQQKEDLSHYGRLLLTGNKKENLIGPLAEKELLSRHFLDAVPLLNFFGANDTIADVGTGAGLPGLILAILSQPPRQIHLIEASTKKARFLRSVVTSLSLEDRVTVLASRSEQLGEQQKNAYNFVVSKALGDLAYGALLAKPLLKLGGCYLALKGQNHLNDIIQFNTKKRIRRFFQEPQIHPTSGDGVVVSLTLNPAT